MTWEKSCGAVVFTVSDGQIQYLLAQSLEGIYGFPKGHMEPGESETETALREVLEETHLYITLWDGFRFVTEYALPNKTNTMKQVVYFLGEYKDQEAVYQKEELISTCLASYDEAIKLLHFDETKQILTEANTFLLNRIGEETK